MHWKNHKSYTETKPLSRPLSVKAWKTREEWEKLFEVFNPYQADILTIIYYVYVKVENNALLTDKDEIKRLKIRSKIFLESVSPFLKPLIIRLSKKVLEDI